MTESERIRKMVEAGTITNEEADRLLAVLQEIDEADRALAAAGEAMEAEAEQALAGAEPAGLEPAGLDSVRPEPAGVEPAQPRQRAGAPRGAEPRSVAGGGQGAEVGTPGPDLQRTAPPSSGAAQVPQEAAAPGATRWVHLSLLAGNLSVRSDPRVGEPEMEGDAEGLRVERTEDGFAVRQPWGGGRASWVDRFLSRIRAGRLEMRVPAGYGVDLSVTAGDVEVRGVPYLRGRLTSGNLDASGLRGIEFATAAGDIDLEMTLTEGRHTLRATAGDVNVRLGAGSDVAVEGSVSIGNATVRAPGFDVGHRGVGQRFQGRIGAGTASLGLHVTTGDVKVTVSDER